MLLVQCQMGWADSHINVQRGDSCMEAFDLHGALRWYERAFAQGESMELRMKLAECHYRRQSYRQCIDLLAPLPFDSLSHKAMRQLFYAYKAMGQSQQQKAWGERILHRYPMDGEVVAELGRAYTVENNLGMAQRVCIAYWFKDHGNHAVNRVLADAYFLDREFDMAKYAYEEMLADGDTTYMVLFNLGVCYARADSLEKARATFTAAINLSAGSMAGAFYHRGMVCNRLNDHDGAARSFAQALSLLLPDSAQMFTCYRGLAESHYARGQYREAAEAFGIAAAYRPQSLTTFYFLAVCLDLCGRHAEAIPHLQTFLRMAEAPDESEDTEALRTLVADARLRLAAKANGGNTSR